MVIGDRARKALEELGLTGYGIRAYSCLLESGPYTAAEISKQSGIPFSKIYDVLSSLEANGWLHIEQSRPSRYFAKSPSTALEALRIKTERERRKNEEEVLNELLPLYEKKGEKEKPEIWIMRGEFNILAKVKELLESCETELMIAIPEVLEGMLEIFHTSMMTIRERGVKVMSLAGESMKEKALREVARWGEVRLRPQMFGGGVVSDSKQVILLLGGESTQGSYLAIWADHVGLAKFARDYFRYLWNDSKEFKPAPLAKMRSAEV